MSIYIYIIYHVITYSYVLSRFFRRYHVFLCRLVIVKRKLALSSRRLSIIVDSFFWKGVG